MKNLLVDCTIGISSDMLLAALYDIGVPENLIQKNVSLLKLEENSQIIFHPALE